MELADSAATLSSKQRKISLVHSSKYSTSFLESSSKSHKSHLKHMNNPHKQTSYIAIPVERTRHSVRVRRDSLLNNPIGSFKGVNSLGRFASSFSRAQSFKAIEASPSQSRSFFKDSDELFDRDTLAPALNGARLSTVIQTNEFDFLRNRPSNGNLSQYDNAIADELTSVVSYCTHQFDTNFVDYGDDARITPLVLKKVESKGKVLTVIAGQSTAPQTIFNSVNVLIGIGLLALPLGLKHAGWVLGIPMLSLCALLTFHSAELLSRCMDTDLTLMTYSDLAYVSFGPKGRVLISFLFSLDLMASGVSLIVLFADSLNALFPKIPINHFKYFALLVLTPPSFLSLNILSLISLLGIASTISVVLVILTSGFLKSSSPGSLIEFAPANFYPKTLFDALVAIGILMAPFGGHAIFPNLKVDMAHPHKFKDSLKITYSITFLTDITMAIIGFLMFGTNVKEEITKSVLLTQGYPKWTYVIICILMSIVPISKTPLNARPIIAIFERLFGISDIIEYKGTGYFWRNMAQILIKIGVNTAFVVVAILFPEFDKIIAFMGASLCFLLCLILPCSFYLIICKETITKQEFIRCWLIIVVSAILSIVSTAATIIY